MHTKNVTLSFCFLRDYLRMRKNLKISFSQENISRKNYTYLSGIVDTSFLLNDPVWPFADNAILRNNTSSVSRRQRSSVAESATIFFTRQNTFVELTTWGNDIWVLLQKDYFRSNVQTVDITSLSAYVWTVFIIRVGGVSKGDTTIVRSKGAALHGLYFWYAFSPRSYSQSQTMLMLKAWFIFYFTCSPFICLKWIAISQCVIKLLLLLCLHTSGHAVPPFFGGTRVVLVLNWDPSQHGVHCVHSVVTQFWRIGSEHCWMGSGRGPTL